MSMPCIHGAAAAPSAIEFTITATMTLAEWRKLAGQLADGGNVGYGPAGWLHSAINDIVRQAGASFEPGTTEVA